MWTLLSGSTDEELTDDFFSNFFFFNSRNTEDVYENLSKGKKNVLKKKSEKTSGSLRKK